MEKPRNHRNAQSQHTEKKNTQTHTCDTFTCERLYVSSNGNNNKQQIKSTTTIFFDLFVVSCACLLHQFSYRSYSSYLGYFSNGLQEKCARQEHNERNGTRTTSSTTTNKIFLAQRGSSIEVVRTNSSIW